MCNVYVTYVYAEIHVHNQTRSCISIWGHPSRLRTLNVRVEKEKQPTTCLVRGVNPPDKDESFWIVIQKKDKKV